MLLHERDQSSPMRYPMEFSHFFESTPPELIKLGLYQKIAVPLLDGQHRLRSLRDAAEAMNKMFTESSLVGTERWAARAGEGEGGRLSVNPLSYFRIADGRRRGWFTIALSSPLGGAAQSSLRSCLNFDLIKGIDDDPLDLTVGNVSLEAHGGRTEEETTAGATKHGGFTLDDVGRRVTIDSKKRQVFIDGVERRMRWFR